EFQRTLAADVLEDGVVAQIMRQEDEAGLAVSDDQRGQHSNPPKARLPQNDIAQKDDGKMRKDPDHMPGLGLEGLARQERAHHRDVIRRRFELRSRYHPQTLQAPSAPGVGPG